MNKLLVGYLVLALNFAFLRIIVKYDATPLFDTFLTFKSQLKQREFSTVRDKV